MTPLLRLVQKSDLQPLYNLVKQVGIGVTTLPKNKDYLAERIDLAVQTQDKKLPDETDGLYMFVLEDCDSNQLLGCSGIVPSVGHDGPFYSYKLSTLVQKSEEVGINQATQILSLVNDYQGYAELCSLYLLPEYRHYFLGRLLSLGRFLFMANFPNNFSDKVIAELRGVSDDKGESPFWNSIGKHFFGLSFFQADQLSGLGKKQFIADLMPKYPVYINLLPEPIQQVIGQPHTNTLPAQHLLESQHFSYHNYVDIFDAGPTLEAERDRIKAIRKSKLMTAKELLQQSAEDDLLVSNMGLNFYASKCRGKLLSECDVALPKAILQALKITLGEQVRVYHEHE